MYEKENGMVPNTIREAVECRVVGMPIRSCSYASGTVSLSRQGRVWQPVLTTECGRLMLESLHPLILMKHRLLSIISRSRIAINVNIVALYCILWHSGSRMSSGST